MPFENFPYADLHNLNIDWLLKKVQAIDPEAIPQAVADALQDMLENGTLEELLRSVYPWIFRYAKVYPEYKAGTLEIIAEYFAIHLASDCVSYFQPDTNSKCAYKYNANKGYAALFNRNSTSNTFVWDDVETVDGTDYPVFYADCSTFLSLITKGIHVNDSPYVYMWQGGTWDLDMDSDLMKSARENPDINIKWTFDFLNSIGTSDMCELMNGTGNPVMKLSTYVPATQESEINTTLIATLRTGDIVFRGLSEETQWWNGINHCGYYLKSLEDLDEYTVNFGFTTQAFTYTEPERNNPAYGYVVEFMGSSDPNGYTNTLRISPLSAWIHYPNSTGTVTVFAAPAMTCWQMSNKQRSEQTMTEQLFNYINWHTGRTHVSSMVLDLVHSVLKVTSIACKGRPLAKNTDLDDLPNGIWRTHQKVVVDSLVHSPIGLTPGTSGMLLISVGTDDLGAFGWQICLDNTSNPSTNPPKIYIRRQGSTGTWHPWYKFTITAA